MLSNTPVCLQCAKNIQKSMFDKYLTEVVGGGQKSLKKENEAPPMGMVGRIYNKVKLLKFI